MDSKRKPELCPLAFLLTYIPLQLTSCQCIGSNCCGHGCCSGFMLDRNTSSCIPCNTGYIGRQCEIICPFPMYGDGCQFRCECDNSSCNPLIGCRATITALQDDRVLTIQYELSSIFSTPPTAESKIKVIRNTAKSLDMTVNKRPTTQYHHSRNGIYHTYFLQANTIKIPKTKEKDRGTLTVGADSPLLIGIFAFNAFFVIIVFTVVLYCGCRKYKKFRKRKKDNSATVIHYHEIDDNIAGPSIDYDPLYTTGVTEKPQATEMKNFLVEYENEPLNREKKSFINTDSQKRRSETSPKQLARPSELVSEQTNMFEGYNAGEKSCKDNDAYIYTPVCKKANVRF